MNEEKERLPFLDLAERHFGEIEHLGTIIDLFRDEPRLLNGLEFIFDYAIEQLNTYLDEGISEKQVKLMPNVLKVQKLLKEKKLPTLYDLENEESFINLMIGERVFKKTQEKTQELIKDGKYSFPRTVDDEIHLVATMMINLYGQAMERKFPELAENAGTTILAVGEVLAHDFKSSTLFKAAREQDWYSIEKGFSGELVSYVERMPAEKH